MSMRESFENRVGPREPDILTQARSEREAEAKRRVEDHETPGAVVETMARTAVLPHDAFNRAGMKIRHDAEREMEAKGIKEGFNAPTFQLFAGGVIESASKPFKATATAVKEAHARIKTPGQKDASDVVMGGLAAGSDPEGKLKEVTGIKAAIDGSLAKLREGVDGAVTDVRMLYERALLTGEQRAARYAEGDPSSLVPPKYYKDYAERAMANGGAVTPQTHATTLAQMTADPAMARVLDKHVQHRLDADVAAARTLEPVSPKHDADEMRWRAEAMATRRASIARAELRGEDVATDKDYLRAQEIHFHHDYGQHTPTGLADAVERRDRAVIADKRWHDTGDARWQAERTRQKDLLVKDVISERLDALELARAHEPTLPDRSR